jgi:hypothetical protein
VSAVKLAVELGVARERIDTIIDFQAVQIFCSAFGRSDCAAAAPRREAI